jgi:apolipoprotein N-acyltransferase
LRFLRAISSPRNRFSIPVITLSSISLLPIRIISLRGIRADLASLGFGATAALALPPLHAVPLLFVAVPGLLMLLSGCPNAAAAARRGWWFGFGLNAAGLYWITEAILFEAERFWWLVPLAVPGLAAVLGLFTAAAGWVAWSAKAGVARVLALAGAWVLADLAKQFVLTGFPWNPLGSVWGIPGGIGDVLIQPAAWIGAHGLTLFTLLLAAAPILSNRARLAGLAVFAVWVGYGVSRIEAPPTGKPLASIAIVQGNVAQGQKWDRTLAQRIFERYLELTAEGVGRAGTAPTIVLWPETASPYLLDRDPTARRAIADAARGNIVLAGSVRFNAEGRPLNSLMALSGEGGVEAIYDKWHLVPFGEYQPSWASIGIQLVPGGGFAAGPGPRSLHLAGLPPVGPLICYEAIFAGQVVDPTDRPAWMANITNDAWFGNSSGPRQHLSAARFRAVEEGLPLMRAANTGISAAFDAYGQEIGRIGMRETGVLSVNLPPALGPTLFSRFGLWIPGLLGLLCLGAAWICGDSGRSLSAAIRSRRMS